MKAKSMFPAKPVPAADVIVPPTNAEKAAFAAKIVECVLNEVDGYEHRLVRLVYAVRRVAVGEERRAILHAHLYLLEPVDDKLFTEAEGLGQQINKAMTSTERPGGKTAMDTALTAEHLPVSTWSQRYMDDKVQKLGATFAEFAAAYPAAPVVVKEPEEKPLP
jgi:hypothetical protein